MLTFGVELLMRRAIITRWDKREAPEWPPHPDRVFMALVAAWGENGENEPAKAALQWLETLPAPDLSVSLEASERTPCTSYVPANDHSSPISKKGKAETPLGSLPFGRARNGRSYPAVVPLDPRFYLIWPDIEVPNEHHAALELLCSQVTYLGHSASPILMWVENDEIPPTLIPNERNATHRLRIYGRGRLDELKSRFDATLRPLPGLWQGYGPPAPVDEEQVEEGPFDRGMLILRQVGGRTFSLESAGMIANTIRKTLMSRHGSNPPEWLTGHASDDAPSTIRRLAYFPLGFVGHEHADGHLLGIGLAVPKGFPGAAMDCLVKLLMKHGEIPEVASADTCFLRLRVLFEETGGRIGELLLELDERPGRQRAYALQPDRWIGLRDQDRQLRPSKLWTTITPVMLPRFPRRSLTKEAVVAQAILDAGFPEPMAIRVGAAPFLSGIPHLRSFHTKRKAGLPPRPLVHVELEFEKPVWGPMLVGAGRYLGLGAFCPIRQEDCDE